jgi:hypothetical protein
VDSDIDSLPDTAALLTSGGDLRIVVDPLTGLSMYGCGPAPDPGLVQLGSSTASVISARGLAAASALRATLEEQLRHHAPDEVYARHATRQRAELPLLCGCAPGHAGGGENGSGIEAILAASGTDLHLLAAQWLQPHLTVMAAPEETGSGLPAALQGRHFNPRTAAGDSVVKGMPVGDWHGELATLNLRHDDGSLRASAEVDADCIVRVDTAAALGQRVMLILTDVSKTGLIAPSIATALALRQRWPDRIDVLVDACQFRVSARTLRAYLGHGCLVALTGSKFMSGPTFCGLLLVPETAPDRRAAALPPGARAYSNAADWPAHWGAAASLKAGAEANFGLLLRWEAAIAEMRAFRAVPTAFVAAFLRQFGQAVTAALQEDWCFEILPVATLRRAALGDVDAETGGADGEVAWDDEQSIFPFVLHAQAAAGWRPLTRGETLDLYRGLRHGGGDEHAPAPRFLLGQPVVCGDRDGVPVSALRLCVSAPMIAAAWESGSSDAAIADALAALSAIAAIVKSM